MRATHRLLRWSWVAVALAVLGLAIGLGLGPRGAARPARAQEDPSVAPAAVGPSTCFQGTSAVPYLQGIAYAPSSRYYLKSYPGPNGEMRVYVSNGTHEVPFYTGYVLSMEADYIAASRSTVLIATVSDQRCGAITNLYVRGAQLNDGASAVSHPFAYRSPHATGAFHREICPTGSTQTIIVMEGDNPLAPTNPPYLPPGSTNFNANMQCPTFSWTSLTGFRAGPLQGCGSCDDLDGEPCTALCYRTPGVMHAGQCDLSAATPLCSSTQVCRIDGTTPHCVTP
jgi:hypothetical protein